MTKMEWEKAEELAMAAYHYPPQDSKRGLELATNLIALALHEAEEAGFSRALEKAAKLARSCGHDSMWFAACQGCDAAIAILALSTNNGGGA